MIQVRELGFSYGAKPVFTGVSFSLQKGGLTALLGRNGSGKTTLMRCLLGLETRYQGTILWDGKDLRAYSPARLSRLIAYIPQTHYPAFNYTALDMVLMGTTGQVGLFSAPGERQRAAAMDALRRMGVDALAERGFTRLSGGEQQLVLIARALAQQSQMLVMDEPTASLDFGNQLRVMAQVRKLCQQGYAVLLSTHNPQHALSYSSRVLALEGGALVADGAPERVMDEALIHKLYGVSARFLSTPEGRVILPEVSYADG